MRILGIETSCDETAAAVIEVQRQQFAVHSNVVASQVKIHARYGGVVPEVAARKHVEAILPVVREALRAAGIRVEKSKPHPLISVPSIDTIAVTTGPGLTTSLLVGAETARVLSYAWQKPLVAVNHLEGHIYANWLPPIREILNSKLQTNFSPYGGSSAGRQFPILCLVVSGGHTELMLMRKHLDHEVIGATRDDAAGEAFDKVAKMLGLGYPGGPIISAMAEKCKMKNVKCKIIDFPRPMINSPDFDFSFSGLKTAVLYFAQKHKRYLKSLTPQICHEFEQAVVDVLVAKTVRAAKDYKVKTVLLGGGVAANKRLRTQLANTVNRELSSVNCILPAAEYTTDNAAMIAAAGYFHAIKKDFTPWQELDVNANWQLGRKAHTGHLSANP